MRLLMFETQRGRRLGALRGGEVVDLGYLAPSILALIDAGPEAWDRALEAAESGARVAGRLADVRVAAPLDPPRGNVLALGRNYGEHAGEMVRAGRDQVTRPTVFTKAQTSITGPFDDIPVDFAMTSQVDWEVELGVVIGRTGRNIRRETALDHVFGYTIVNDLSARDIQYGWGGQFFKGKSLDGFCPVGPWIVTADEIADPQSFELRLRVNGVEKQRGTTADMIFPVDELIAQLSLGMTLPAGTLIASGTPSGVGYARNPPEFLQAGDVVESEIVGLGLLRNRIVKT